MNLEASLVGLLINDPAAIDSVRIEPNGSKTLLISRLSRRVKTLGQREAMKIWLHWVRDFPTRSLPW